MKTIWTGRSGKVELRVVDTGTIYVGLADGKKLVEAQNADEVRRRLNEELGKLSPRYVAFPGAINRFLHFFPNGFHSKGYEEGERDYKLRARSKLHQQVPLADAVNGSGFGEAVLAAYNATNLLSPFEKMRVRDVLQGPAADQFVRAAARFALGEIVSALPDLERALKPKDAAKWTVITYLPFLWGSDANMFLKPTVTVDFAERVGHRFASDYSSRLHPDVYASLLDLAANTEKELASLQPRDRIDIQSFIWVVGDYKDDAEQPQP